jgi:isoleucyl-tRNA synthetase
MCSTRTAPDALRWYLVTTSPPWSPTRFDRDGVKDTARKMLENLRNVYAFYSLYAGIDEYAHSADRGTPTLLDRWILSRYTHHREALARVDGCLRRDAHCARHRTLRAG